MNPTQQSAKIAKLRLELSDLQSALWYANRDMEECENALLATNPPRGSNETERKLARTIMLHQDKEWARLEAEAFSLKAQVHSAEARLESEKDIRQGMEWQIRMELASKMDKPKDTGMDYAWDTERPFDDVLPLPSEWSN